MSQPAKRPNSSLQKKSAARMAAVQCFYRQAITGDTTSADAQVERLKKQLVNNKDEQKMLVGAPIEPDYTMLARLLEGGVRLKSDIYAVIDANLGVGWTRARMSPLIIAVLQCGVFEMLHDKGLGHPIVVNEYTQLARHFFDAKEVDFVHAVLSRVMSHG